MCGFISIINCHNYKQINDNLNLLKKINYHRGPDNIKILHDKNFSILFRRLSILDTSANSNQPFKSSDKKKILVFNGEIYNYLELKDILKKKYKFYTTSDTEVVMKCYEEWGINFTKKLRGMFSIILFDNTLNKVFLIRDPLGQKPLYYSFLNKGLIVSSEIKDIIFLFKKSDVPILENQKIVDKYLIRGWADDSDCSFFKNIFQVKAGSFMNYNYKSLSNSVSYWNLDISKKRKFNLKLFKKKLNENIKIHLRSDVPVAFTLSGGLDSGSIVKISKKFKKKITAFSIINSFSNEKKNIKKFLEENKINHYFLKTEKFYKKNTLRKLIEYQDEPIISPSHIDQFLLRKKIKSKGFKVILVGEGADEILGGYLRQAIIKLTSIENKTDIYKNLKKYFGIDKADVENKILKFKKRKKNDHDMEDLMTLEFLKKKKLSEHLRHKNTNLYGASNIFKKSLKEQILFRDLPHIIRAEDRISMANSIESRSPFLDQVFIDYILSHSPKYYFKNGIPKFMLRKAMTNILPQEYIDAKKVPRPGNDIKIMKFYSKEFKILLKKHKLLSFNKTKILKRFKSDSKKIDFNKSSYFYFRVFNYILWKEIYFS